MLQTRLLGQFLLSADSETIDIPSRPAQSLFAYLILNAGMPQRREHIADLFWPDSSIENARSNLRHALWRIRKALHACRLCSQDLIYADDFTICFNAAADYWLDTEVLQSQGDHALTANALLDSVSVYNGELLPGFYDSWILLEREHLQAVFDRKMDLLLQYLLAQQNWPAVLQQGERWIALGLSPEPAYGALMIAHTALDNVSSMAAVYQRCCHDLQHNLGVQPSAHTKELFDQLSQGRLPELNLPLMLQEETSTPEPPHRANTQAEHDRLQNQLERTQAQAAQDKKMARQMAREKRQLGHWSTFLTLLLLLAFIITFLALHQATRSRQQARLNQARELAAVAINQLQSDPELSLLLALTAVESMTAAGEPLPAEVVTAFRQALQSLRVLLTVPGTGGVAFSPDGRYLATTGLDDRAKIYNVLTGQEVIAFGGHTADLLNLVYSPNGTRLITTSLDGQAKIWDVYSGQELLSLVGHEAGLISAAFTPGGARVLTTSFDGTARVWDVYTGQELAVLDRVGIATGAAFMPSGDQVLIADPDAFTARLWDITSGQEIRRLVGHTAGVNDVAVSPDGRHLLTTSNDKTAKLWDAASGALLLTLHHDSEVLGADFSPDGSQIAAASQKGTIAIWDVGTGRAILTLPGQPGETTHVAFSPDGNRLASGGAQTKVWDISPAGSHELMTIAAHDGPVSAIAYDAAGQRLASAGWNGTVKIWDAHTGMLLQRFTGHAGRVAFVTFSPENERLATAGYDGIACIWNLNSAAEEVKLIPSAPVATQNGSNRPWVLSVTFSPDGRYLVTTSQDGIVKIWDAATAQELFALSGHTGIVFRAAFSPSGRLLATAGDDLTSRIWDSKSGKELLRLNGHQDGVTAAVFSPNGQQLATSSFDKTIRLWDTRSGAELNRLSAHTAAVWDLAFDPAGRYLYSIGFDGTVRQWDPATGESLLLFAGDVGPDLALSPDGRYLATTSTTGLIRIHILSMNELIETARSRLTRGLTIAECRQFLHQPTCPPS